MPNDFELYDVHVESSEIEKWSILSTKVDDVEISRKAILTNKVKFNLTEGRGHKGYRQVRAGNRTCQEVDFNNMTEQLQADYLYRHKVVQGEIHQVSQFGESSAVCTAYLDKVSTSRENAINLNLNCINL